MNMKESKTEVGEFINMNSEYYRISKAAELLHCTQEDLLHLGVNYKVEIMAPVVSNGMYIWAIDSGSECFPEIVGEVKQYFDAADRVLLSWIDLAKIEAVGWAVPEYFYSPSVAQEIGELLSNCVPINQDEYEPTDTISLTKNENGSVVFSLRYLPSKLLKRDSELLPKRRAISFIAPWYPEVSPNETADKITIGNLFISKQEVERIKAGDIKDAATRPSRGNPNKPTHGNAERFAVQRELVYVAAIYCQHKWPERCKDPKEWAEQIEINAEKIWPDAKEPSRNVERMRRMIVAAFDGKVFKE